MPTCNLYQYQRVRAIVPRRQAHSRTHFDPVLSYSMESARKLREARQIQELLTAG